MKKTLMLFTIIFALSSCSTLFTSSRQNITFAGMQGARIFDAASNIKLAEIGSSKEVTISVKKKMGDKLFLVKKEGYRNTPIALESSFNSTTLWNLLFWPGFIVDAATGQMNKYDNTYINIEMEEE